MHIIKDIAASGSIVQEQHLRHNTALMTVFPAIIPLDINRNETAFTEEEVWCNTLDLILCSLVCNWRTLPLATINTSIQQRRIQNQVNIYDEAFLLLAVNYFCKKAPWQMFDWVLNTPLQNINQFKEQLVFFLSV